MAEQPRQPEPPPPSSPAPPSTPASIAGPPLTPDESQLAKQKSAGGLRNTLWVFLGVLGALVVFTGGCMAIVIAGVDSAVDDIEEDALAYESTEVDEAPTSTGEANSTQPGADDQTNGLASLTEQVAGEPDEVDDVLGCSVVAEDTILLDVVNNSSKTSDYWITIAYINAEGNRVGDESNLISALRPGEHTIEEVYSFDDTSASCETISVERTSTASEPLDAVTGCNVVGVDVFNDAEAVIEVMNPTSKLRDYWVTVAFIDAAGIRRGTGTATIDAVRPGESAPSDVFTTTPAEGIVQCEAISVN